MVKRSQGYILIVALVVIALMLAAGALLASALQYRMWLLRQESENVRLSALADAGVAHALERLFVSDAWAGAEAYPLDGGTVLVEVDDGDSISLREVRVTVTYGRARRVVLAVVELNEADPPRVIAWEPIAAQTGQLQRSDGP